MKFLLSLAVIVVTAVLYFRFFGNPNQSINPFGNNASSSTAAYTNQTQSGKSSAGTGNSTSSGFKGPTGPPHIIGPSANPPNY